MKKIILVMVCMVLIGCKDNQNQSQVARLEEIQTAMEETQKSLMDENRILKEQVEALEEDLALLKDEKEVLDALNQDNQDHIRALKEENMSLKATSGLENPMLYMISGGASGFHYQILEGQPAIYRVQVMASDGPLHVDPESYEVVAMSTIGTGETLEMMVFGKIVNFQVVQVFWDEAQGDLVEGPVLKTLETVENTILLLDTYLNEGIPSGKLRWENTAGEVFEYYLSQDGYGFTGSVIICNE